jgi:Fe-S-cluster containining protein
MVHAFTDAVVGAASKGIDEQGSRKISCKRGCGACCRQLVPVAEVEAHQIRRVIDRQPEPRRTEILARFAAARRMLEVAGLLGNLLHPEGWNDGEGRTLGMRYFQEAIACPFLEEESCSIYADRPSACREYLVTSPAENCRRPTPETVQVVKLPLKMWTALARFDEVSPTRRFIRWVPLILAPEWASAHPEDPATRPGPELVRELFERLTDRRQRAS